MSFLHNRQFAVFLIIAAIVVVCIALFGCASRGYQPEGAGIWRAL